MFRRIGDSPSARDTAVITSIGTRFQHFLARQAPLMRVELEVGNNASKREIGIHASELGGCSRRQVMTMLGFATTPGGKNSAAASTRLIFDIGTAWHGIIQGYLGVFAESVGAKYTPEIQITPSTSEVSSAYDIYSHSDGIWEEEEVRINLELKSKKSELFKKMTAPDPSHVKQNHLYMRVLDLPATWYLYVDKSNGEITPSTPSWVAPAPGPRTPANLNWVLPFVPEFWELLECRIQYARMHASMGTLPPREESWLECRSCQYRKQCDPAIVRGRK